MGGGIRGIVAVCAAGAVVVVGGGCGDMHGGWGKKTLYERLGSEAAVKSVVHDFVGRAANDPKVNFTRAGTPKKWDATAENVQNLEMHLVNLIGSLTGGPQKYTGRDMKTAHTGMGITKAEFDALAGDLKAALDAAGAKPEDRDELIKIVASTEKDIVGV